MPEIIDGKIYQNIGKFATCNNITTGELIWRRELDGPGSFGGVLISEPDNKMIISTLSGSKKTYGLDLETGNISWITTTTGNNGQPYALNGVAYFTSNGDGKLHALDIATGDYIWKIDSPDDSSNNSFRGELTGIPGKNGEKGRIFTSSFLNAFCFEAAR